MGLSKARKLLVMGVIGGGAAAETNLLNDQFTTAASAPLTSPRTAEPGPGAWTITDTGNRASIANGELALAGHQVIGEDPRAVFSFTRLAGTVLAFSCRGAHLTAGFSITGAASVKDGVKFYSSTLYQYKNGGDQAVGLAISSATDYDVKMVMRNSGAMVFIKGGAYTEWRLLGCLDGATAMTANVMLQIFLGAQTAYYDDVLLWKAHGEWSKRFPMATDAISAVATGDTLTTTADCVMAVVCRMKANGILNLLVRYLDDENHYVARFTEAGAAGTITIHSVIEGTESAALATASSVNFLVGTPAVLSVRCEGANIVASFGVKIASYASATFQQTQTGAKINYVEMNSVTDLSSHPVLLEPPTTISATHPLHILLYGDSKMATAPYYVVADIFETARGAGIYEHPGRVGRSGAGLATFHSTVDADLAARTDTPDVIFVDIGINDTSPVPDETTWKADYAYVLDAMHTKWASAQIYVAYVWKIDPGTTCDTLAGWIDAVLATRPWASVGVDERIALEGGDNGATNMTDSLHPNTAGFTAIFTALAATMGY